VNLKIALSVPVREGLLPPGERNELLASMTPDVAALVLRNNYLQTLAISLAERRAVEDLGFEQRLMQMLEARELLDRGVEFLPSDAELAERGERGLGLTRPELAVMLAYAKLALYDALIESDVPDDPYLARELARYFPRAVAERFPDALQRHRLRREIIATMLANSMINRGGPSLIARVADDTGADAASIAMAFTAARDCYGMTELNGAIDHLDARIDGELQLSLYASVQNLLLDRINWFLRNGDLSKGLVRTIERYREGVAAVGAALDDALPEGQQAARRTRAAGLVEVGVPEKLAWELASLSELAAAPDIVVVANRTNQTVAAVTRVYFAVRDYFRLDRVIAAAHAIEIADHFDRLALNRALTGIAVSQREIAAAAVVRASSAEAVEIWATQHDGVERVRSSIHRIAEAGLNLSKLAVVVGLLADLSKT
jgi:glutamate dehydrogenase